MPLNVLIAPDKFKGTLPAGAVAEALARGWRRARPRDRLARLPITDGGDGFGPTLGNLFQAKIQRTSTVDPAHRRRRASWWWQAERRTAIIESAAAIGLATLPPRRFHPFELDTFGLGALFRAALEKGARQCLVGIGGSATNDGGFGLARALGWRFLDAAGKEIREWTALARLETIQPTSSAWFESVVVAVDVRNPLLGPKGASQIYGAQKGLRLEDLPLAEACLGRLAAVARRVYGKDLARLPGAGAAGGLGFGLMAFAGAQLVPGFELFASAVNLRRQLKAADLVLTGEGALDQSTFMGKGVGELARHCKVFGLPCLAFTGSARSTAICRRMFARVFALSGVTTEKQALARPAFWLERLAETAATQLEMRRNRRRSC